VAQKVAEFYYFLYSRRVEEELKEMKCLGLKPDFAAFVGMEKGVP